MQNLKTVQIQFRYPKVLMTFEAAQLFHNVNILVWISLDKF